MDQVSTAPPSRSRKHSSGNNSDNNSLAVDSIGNNSFGFNFDAEEAMMANDSQAADNAVAGLASIATTYNKEAQVMAAMTNSPVRSSGAVVSMSSMGDCIKRPTKKAKLLHQEEELSEDKREERNAREKERSFRISRQITELRNLLSSGGVIVPKGTKSSVLTEAANYIRMLQQHQYKSEIDRHQLVQQLQMIGGGALGPQAASAVRHVAAQNGVWSLGNFGGVPPKSAMTYYEKGKVPPEGTSSMEKPLVMVDPGNAPVQTNIGEHEYRFVFNSCSVAMAVASMGGAFIDCNQLFCQLSNYSKQEVCSMTVFNLTSRQDLQSAFDLISQMISPPGETLEESNPRPCVLRGSMKNRYDLGLSVALVKGDDNIAKCFCITLIKNPTSAFDTSKPVPATSADLIQQVMTKDAGSGNLNSAPAYTTG